MRDPFSLTMAELGLGEYEGAGYQPQREKSYTMDLNQKNRPCYNVREIIWSLERGHRHVALCGGNLFPQDVDALARAIQQSWNCASCRT